MPEARRNKKPERLERDGRRRGSASGKPRLRAIAPPSARHAAQRGKERETNAPAAMPEHDMKSRRIRRGGVWNEEFFLLGGVQYN